MVKIYSEDERQCFKCREEIGGKCLDCLRNDELKRKEHLHKVRMSVLENISQCRLNFSLVNPDNEMEYYDITYKNNIPVDVKKCDKKLRTFLTTLRERIIFYSYRRSLMKRNIRDIDLIKIVILGIKDNLKNLRNRDLNDVQVIDLEKYNVYLSFNKYTPKIEIVNNTYKFVP